jgi:hypothetical protein
MKTGGFAIQFRKERLWLSVKRVFTVVRSVPKIEFSSSCPHTLWEAKRERNTLSTPFVLPPKAVIYDYI